MIVKRGAINLYQKINPRLIRAGYQINNLFIPPAISPMENPRREITSPHKVLLSSSKRRSLLGENLTFLSRKRFYQPEKKFTK